MAFGDKNKPVFGKKPVKRVEVSGKPVQKKETASHSEDSKEVIKVEKHEQKDLPLDVIPSSSSPMDSAEVVWRGTLRKVIHHQPNGVKQRNGKIGSGWGIFSVDPINQKHLPADMQAHADVYRRGNWSVKGVLIGDPEEGMELICHGKFAHNEQYGEQFDASVIVEPLPDIHDLKHIEAWLIRKSKKSNSRIIGMTPKRARKAIEHFGFDVMKALAEPKRLREIFHEKLCKPMADSFKQEGRSYRLHIFFLEHGFHQGNAKNLINHLESEYRETGKAWTVDSVIQQTRRNPYWLTKVKGIGFLVADRLAKKLGMKDDDPFRLRAGILYALDLRELKGGHTVTHDKILLKDAASEDVMDVNSMDNPEKSRELLKKTLKDMTEESSQTSDLLSWKVVDDQGFASKVMVAKSICGYSERYVASRAWDMVNTGSRRMIPVSELEKTFDIESASQRSAVILATSKRMGILTGGPGTGKTTCLKSIAYAAQNMGLKVKLCTPSGKAASRLRQTTGMHATTIHSLLKFFSTDDHSEYGPHNPYVADLFIVDEASMVDVYLMRRLLNSIDSDASVLLVGDSEQLPSIGPGRIFGDLIDSGRVPVGRLTENRRQGSASDIPAAASKVSDGLLPCAVTMHQDKFIPDAEDFFSPYWTDFFNTDKPKVESAWIVKNIQENIRLLENRGVPVESIQILSPKKDGDLGINLLNDPMTLFLNPAKDQFLKDFPQSQQTPLELGTHKDGLLDKPDLWMIGDRVIQMRNNHDEDVFNGDMGVIVWTEPESDDQKASLAVYYESGDLPVYKDFMRDFLKNTGKNPNQIDIETMKDYANFLEGQRISGLTEGRLIWYDSYVISQLKKAGVLTIHKTQGSEYAYVFMILHGQHHFMASRPLLYTGMTRAKKGLRLYLSESAAKKAIKNKGAERNTFLAYRLKTGMLD